MTEEEQSEQNSEPEPATDPASSGPASRDIIPAAGRSIFSSPVLRWAAIAILTLVLLASAGVAYATYDYHQEYRGRILPGATIAGLDVGGLTHEQAVAAVDAVLTPKLERTITLAWNDRTWDVTPSELGARSRTQEAVEAALLASTRTSLLDKAQMRVFGSDRWFENSGVISHPRKPMMAFIRGLASSFDREPRETSIDYSSGWVKMRPAKDGRRVRVQQTVKSLRTVGLRTGSAALSVEVRKAKKTPDKFDQILLLRIGENRLYLYEDGQITKEWSVATGQPEYPTPTGLYEITEKRYLPTWVNPDPTGWGASMPASIPPGPGNPLGLRALNWDAPAIRFHGTSAVYSLGYNASHGCVRMANEDVIELYDLIEVGTPIVSTIVAPLRPLYAAAPDPTVVTDPEPPTAPDDSAEQQGQKDSDESNAPGQRKKN